MASISTFAPYVRVTSFKSDYIGFLLPTVELDVIKDLFFFSGYITLGGAMWQARSLFETYKGKMFNFSTSDLCNETSKITNENDVTEFSKEYHLKVPYIQNGQFNDVCIDSLNPDDQQKRIDNEVMAFRSKLEQMELSENDHANNSVNSNKEVGDDAFVFNANPSDPSEVLMNILRISFLYRNLYDKYNADGVPEWVANRMESWYETIMTQRDLLNAADSYLQSDISRRLQNMHDAKTRFGRLKVVSMKPDDDDQDDRSDEAIEAQRRAMNEFTLDGGAMGGGDMSEMDGVM